MHKIAAKEFELDDFSHDHLFSTDYLDYIIDALNEYRGLYLKKKEWNEPDCKDFWWQLIQLLPSSYNQKRTVTMNYENVMTIIKQRTGHKLDEWNEFVKILELLPYVHEIMNGE